MNEHQRNTRRIDITQRFNAPLRRIRNTGLWIAFIAAVVCLTAIVLYGGIYHTPATKKIVLHLIHSCQIVFAAYILFNLIFFYRATRRENRPLKWVMDCALMFTLIPLLYPEPQHPLFPLVNQIIFSRWLTLTILTLYSVLELSYGVGRLLGKRTNPSLLLASSFLFFILVGSVILMLPRCTVEGISYIDSLFIATSAVSITGLTPLEISEVFTPFGIAMLAILIQIGALGVLTFTSFFAMFFSGNSSIYNQLLVRDMVYSKRADSILPTLLYVFMFTLVVELIGAVAIYFSLPSDFSITHPGHRVLFAAFQSLSAFCNAGFTWLDQGMGNPVFMNSNQLIYITVGILVMLGGIGFPILVNLKNSLFEYLHRLRLFIFGSSSATHRRVHLYDVNTKIVLVTTLTLTVLTIVFFLLFEWNGTLQGMPTGKKLVQAFFNASIPRSSGFASVNPAMFMPSTLVMMMFLMWIGGSSQSTAGGIKVNTFAAMMLNLKSIVTEKKYITAFKRTVAVDSVRRANSVVALSLVSYFLFAMILISLEPNLPLKSLLFETASALFTVGSTLGATPLLGTGAKILLCIAMFLGRVGLLSVLTGLCSRRQNDKHIFPYDNIIIN